MGAPDAPQLAVSAILEHPGASSEQPDEAGVFHPVALSLSESVESRKLTCHGDEGRSARSRRLDACAEGTAAGNADPGFP